MSIGTLERIEDFPIFDPESLQGHDEDSPQTDETVIISRREMQHRLHSELGSSGSDVRQPRNTEEKDPVDELESMQVVWPDKASTNTDLVNMADGKSSGSADDENMHRQPGEPEPPVPSASDSSGTPPPPKDETARGEAGDDDGERSGSESADSEPAEGAAHRTRRFEMRVDPEDPAAQRLVEAEPKAREPGKDESAGPDHEPDAPGIFAYMQDERYIIARIEGMVEDALAQRRRYPDAAGVTDDEPGAVEDAGDYTGGQRGDAPESEDSRPESEAPVNEDFLEAVRQRYEHNQKPPLAPIIEEGDASYQAIVLAGLRDGVSDNELIENVGFEDFDQVNNQLILFGRKLAEAGYDVPLGDDGQPLGMPNAPYYVQMAISKGAIQPLETAGDVPELTASQRQAIFLTSQGWNYWEIANGLGVEPGTVIEQLFNARLAYRAPTDDYLVSLVLARDADMPGIESVDPYEKLRHLPLKERLNRAGRLDLSPLYLEEGPDGKPLGKRIGVCNFRDFRVAVESGDQSRNDSTSKLREKLFKMGDEGYNAWMIVAELRANYMTLKEDGTHFVKDTDARHIVVSRDRATGHLVVEYYSFAEVKESTFQSIVRSLDPSAYSVEKRLIMGVEPDVKAEGESNDETVQKVGFESEHGRGFALIVAHSLSIKEDRLGIGGRLRIEVNPKEVDRDELRRVLLARGGEVLPEEQTPKSGNTAADIAQPGPDVEATEDTGTAKSDAVFSAEELAALKEAGLDPDDL